MIEIWVWRILSASKQDVENMFQLHSTDQFANNKLGCWLNIQMTYVPSRFFEDSNLSNHSLSGYFYNSKVMDFTVVKNNSLKLHDTELSRLGYQTAVWSYAF